MKRRLQCTLVGFVLSSVVGVAQSLAENPLSCEGAVQVCKQHQSYSATLIQHGMSAQVVTDSNDNTAVLRAARNLQADLLRVAGNDTKQDDNQQNKHADLSKSVIIIGTLGHSELIDKLVRNHKLDVSGVAGVWEAFVQQVVDHPMAGVDRALVIAGNDRRGTVFGIYTLSSDIGVSPWSWWADVPVQHHANLYVNAGRRTDAPKVRYRGIFLNDENPALYGWVDEKFGGFNHQFYEHVFDLILRLKGNYLWPAMWGKAIYDDDPITPALANEMGIVLGTSHHEPMMRANVEWQRYGGGTPWDYAANGERLREFWREGIQRMDDNESIVTVGMRGDGDEPMSQDTAINLLERIVSDQRQIIADVTHRDPATVPQAWALYKEVQDYYDQGMRVPEDVTLLFSDDNWGNIRRLPKLGDQRRGGYGMYYHYDYVGGPRNYKWINTNQIERVWEQMHLAYDYGVDRIWIVNVGDLKPMEYPIEFFLDYAWNPSAYPLPRLNDYPRQWAAQQFGDTHAMQIGKLLTRYTQYNARRKPELLAPDTYSLINFHEAERIVADYNKLTTEAAHVGKQLATQYQDAYFQLVQFPIAASANLNELYVTAGLNHLHAEQGRADTNALAARVDMLFARDAELTQQYHALGDGRWNHFMDQTHIGYTTWQEPAQNTKPEVQHINLSQPAKLGVAVAGDTHAWPGSAVLPTLPALTEFGARSQYIEVFNRGATPLHFTMEVSQPWLKLSQSSGTISEQARIVVSVDWTAVPAGNHQVSIVVRGANDSVKVTAYVIKVANIVPAKEYVEADGYVAIEAAHFTRAISTNGIQWNEIPNLGRTHSSVTPLPTTAATQKPGGNSPHLEYAFYLFDRGPIDVQVTLAPTLNFTGEDGLRYAVSIDDESPQIINMHTASNGHADDTDKVWNRWVADNVNIQTSKHEINAPGTHTIKLWMIDPGVVFERVVATTRPLPMSYLGPPESILRQ